MSDSIKFYDPIEVNKLDSKTYNDLVSKTITIKIPIQLFFTQGFTDGSSSTPTFDVKFNNDTNINLSQYLEANEQVKDDSPVVASFTLPELYEVYLNTSWYDYGSGIPELVGVPQPYNFSLTAGGPDTQLYHEIQTNILSNGIIKLLTKTITGRFIPSAGFKSGIPFHTVYGPVYYWNYDPNTGSQDKLDQYQNLYWDSTMREYRTTYYTEQGEQVDTSYTGESPSLAQELYGTAPFSEFNPTTEVDVTLSFTVLKTKISLEEKASFTILRSSSVESNEGKVIEIDSNKQVQFYGTATYAGNAVYAEASQWADTAKTANNAAKINDLQITRDDNGVLKIGEIIIPQRRLVFETSNFTHETNGTITVPDATGYKNKKVIIEIENLVIDSMSARDLFVTPVFKATNGGAFNFFVMGSSSGFYYLDVSVPSIPRYDLSLRFYKSGTLVTAKIGTTTEPEGKLRIYEIID